MQPYMMVNITGVKSPKPCYACYDVAGERVVVYGADRAEMCHVVELLNRPSGHPLPIDGKTRSGGAA